jgi:transposase
MIGHYLNPRTTRRSSASMRKRPSTLSTAWIRCCRSRRAAPSATASNAIATARCRHMPRSTRGRRRGRPHGRAPHQRGLRAVSQRGGGHPAGPARHSHHPKLPTSPCIRPSGADALAAHPGVRPHFTPTYASRLTQVELCFAKNERDVFTSKTGSGAKDSPIC